MFEVSRGDASRCLDAVLAAYLEGLVRRNLSPLTLSQESQTLNLLAGFLRARGIVEAAQVDTAALEAFKAWQSTDYRTKKGAPLVNCTIIARVNQVKAFFAWMKRKGVIHFDPAAEIRPPRHVKRLPKGVLSQAEIRRVMAQPDLKTPQGYGDRTIMEVLYATGMRAAEVCALEISDVDLTKKAARIRRGKGAKERFVPLTTPCCRFLTRYLAEMRPLLTEAVKPCGRLWLEKSGTGGARLFLSVYGGPVNTGVLSVRMKGYMRRAGITRAVSPVHGFRHSVATHLISSGMDVRFVQTLLGHSNINSTQIYTHVERDTLRARVDEHHPRAKAGEQVMPFVEEEHAALA